MTRELTFARCRVYIYPNGWVETIFSDQSRVTAAPHDTPAYYAQAAALGYEGDSETAARAMNREHDPLHSFLAERLGLPCSPTLWAVAHGEELPAEVSGREEAMVLQFQALLNADAEPESMVLAELVRQAKEMLR